LKKRKNRYSDSTIPKEVEEKQIALKELRASRNNEKVKECLSSAQSAKDGTNLMPRILDCAMNSVTLGEMCSELKTVFGVYEEQTVF
jgi:methylmalonyl-CoA mutase N-terminal domain/subunit